MNFSNKLFFIVLFLISFISYNYLSSSSSSTSSTTNFNVPPQESHLFKSKVNLSNKTNLLFIIYDDLRPELSIYGKNYMITPQFERLASHSVTFDRSLNQIAVCNPSRSSIMTGLRPDYCGSLNFEGGIGKSITIPSFLKMNGYYTASQGKIFHWEKLLNNHTWSDSSSSKDWYTYQNKELNSMNSSVMPDKLKPIETYRDSIIVKEGLALWSKALNQEKPWMMAFGFKLPHLALHLPYRFYELYKDFESEINDDELKFPSDASDTSFKSFNYDIFDYMNEEGSKKSNKNIELRGMNKKLDRQIHLEIMRGYMGSISFLDSLLGQLLDFMDTHELWNNTAVILTSDHGMHNGEKGIWNKWTLFDESTRVPLLISHPLSPYKGKRYEEPVELIDIYPTIIETFGLDKSILHRKSNKMIQGQSLAPVIFGQKIYSSLYPKRNDYFLIDGYKPKNMYNNSNLFKNLTINENEIDMPFLFKNYSISQVIKCINLENVISFPRSIAIRNSYNFAPSSEIKPRKYNWRDCSPKTHSNIKDYTTNYHDLVRDFTNKRDKDFNIDNKYPNNDELVVMGYSLRTKDFRYTSYFFFDRLNQRPILNASPYDEELYDHQNDKSSDYNKREYFNLAADPVYTPIVLNYREKLINILSNTKFINRGFSRKNVTNNYFSKYIP